MTETMVIRHVIVKKEDLVDVFPEKAPGNTRPAGTGWVKRIQKWNIGPTKISVKLDVYRFIYHIIPLKDVTKIDILTKIYGEPRKRRK